MPDGVKSIIREVTPVLVATIKESGNHQNIYGTAEFKLKFKTELSLITKLYARAYGRLSDKLIEIFR